MHETVGVRPSGWSPEKNRRDDVNAHIEYIQQLFNKPIKLFFLCTGNLFRVFFYFAGDNKDIAKSRKCEIN